MRNKARKLFEQMHLSYDKITPLDIRRLNNIIEDKLIEYLETGDFHAQQMSMKVSPMKKNDMCFVNNGLEYAFIKIDGAYFKGREGISFNRNGFIGFGAEFSDVNVKPILKAFVDWCCLMVNKETGINDIVIDFEKWVEDGSDC